MVIRYRVGDGDPFARLDAELARRLCPNDLPFPTGAAIGYFGYGLKNVIEKLPARAHDDLGLPDCWFGFYHDLWVFDHVARQLYRITVPEPTGGEVPKLPAPSKVLEKKPANSNLRANFTYEGYCAAVHRVKEYIVAGDVYQVNLSQRFQCEVAAPPPEVYAALRQANPAPHAAYLDIGDAQVLSSSPECFLKMTNRQIATRPIKGTAPSTTNPFDLLQSQKNNAELLMIVDLERNDLGRVCEFGSVQVPQLVAVESYATVHHLVATVTGILRPGVSHVNAARTCFPGGSVTGAPKIRAMEIIDELEPHARGVYCGAIGYFGFNNVSQLNIAIRTVVQQGSRLTFHAGGAIVADSEPSAEYEETLAKARGILNAIDQLRFC